MSFSRETDPLLQVASAESSVNASSSRLQPPGGSPGTGGVLNGSYSSVASSSAHSSSVGSSVARQYNISISTDTTAAAITKCEKFILTPYSHALKIIGWLPYKNSQGGYVLQILLIFMWLLCITATMVTQVLVCFKRDPFLPVKTITNATALPPPTVTSDPLYTAYGGTRPPKVMTCESHVISALILSDIVLFLAYFFGIYLFGRGESEHLFALASRVFIKNSEAESSSRRLIITIEVLFICGFIWLLFSLSIRVLTSFAMELFDDNLYIQWNNLRFRGPVKISLLVFSLFGFFTFDMVYMFSIMNYVAQAEMNIYLLWDVRRLIEIRKYDHIDGGIKDTQKCKRYIDILNGKTATHTGLALFVLANFAVQALINLNTVKITPHLYPQYYTLDDTSAVLGVVCWTLLVSLPFIQAARVTYWCDKLKDLGPEIRGRVHAAYAGASQLDLNSMLSFLYNIKLRAAIFGVPISPWLLYLFLVSFCFTMLVLFQVNAYRIVEYI